MKKIDDCVPPGHPLRKIINRNTIKMSYRCMPNMGQVISRHNSKVASENSAPDPPPRCSCRGGPPTCPLGGGCEVKEVIYCASVERLDTHTTEKYTGLTGGPFKARYNKHQSDFRHEKNENSTCLSKHVWDLKKQKIPYKIDWQILARGRVFNPVSKKCRLCLLEKFYIMFKPETATLNDRSELYNTFRHRLQQLLQKIKD